MPRRKPEGEQLALPAELTSFWELVAQDRAERLQQLIDTWEANQDEGQGPAGHRDPV